MLTITTLINSKKESRFLDNCRKGTISSEDCTNIPQHALNRGLARAAGYGHLDTIHLLADNGAEMTPFALKWACSNGHLKAAALLLMGGCPTTKEAAMEAAQHGYSEIEAMLQEVLDPADKSDDPQYEEHKESLNTIVNDFSWKETFRKAAEIRDGYKWWLFRKIDENKGSVEFFESEVKRLNGDDVFFCPACENFPETKSCSCGEKAIVITDDGINRWGTRPEVSDVEWGEFSTPPSWKYTGWAANFDNQDEVLDSESQSKDQPDYIRVLRFDNEYVARWAYCSYKTLSAKEEEVLTVGLNPYSRLWEVKLLNWKDSSVSTDASYANGAIEDKSHPDYFFHNENVHVHNDVELQEEADRGMSLCFEKEEAYPTRKEAASRWKSLKSQWARGNHTTEALSGGLDVDGYYKILTVFTPINWTHLMGLSKARDEIFSTAVSFIKGCNDIPLLHRVDARARQHSRDAVVRKSGKLFDDKRKTGIGLDYPRYATIINAIADRAAELGYSKFRRLTIKEFPKPEDKGSQDLLDRGAQQGEFLLDSVPDSVMSLLLEDVQQTWSPSKHLESRLYFRAFEESDCPTDLRTGPRFNQPNSLAA